MNEEFCNQHHQVPSGGQFSQHRQQEGNQTRTTNGGNGGGFDGGPLNHQQHQKTAGGLYPFNNDVTATNTGRL